MRLKTQRTLNGTSSEYILVVTLIDEFECVPVVDVSESIIVVVWTSVVASVVSTAKYSV